MKSSNKKLPIILFDIDYTLFDVGYFDNNFHKYLSELFSIDKSLIREKSTETILDLIKKDYFLDIDKFLQVFLSKIDKKQHIREIEEFLFGKDFFKRGFYPEVEFTIRSLKNAFRLGIFSQGHKKLQGAKINQSGLRKFFDDELIYIKKPLKLNFLPHLKERHINDKIILVDDKLEVLYEVKKYIPSFFTVWVKRGKYAEKQKNIEGFKPELTVFDLKNLKNLLKVNRLNKI